MKAWELEKELQENAQPVVLAEEEQTWGVVEAIETTEDNKLKMLWSSRVPGSGAPERLIIGAIQSMDNMGFDTGKAEALIEEGLKAFHNDDMIELNRITARIYYELNRLPKDQSSKYWEYKEYTSWEDYCQAVTFATYPRYDVTARDFEEKIRAGWMAQICGGALGTAIEGYTTENLKKAFGDIRDYVRKPNTFNDDITYELAFLEAFEKNGYQVTSREIAEEWAALIPFGWSAEDVALRNLKCGVFPPESGLLNNPFREWIGAQMRGAICGMVAPGNPQEAARLAWVDGVISHYNNGVIGEIFNALMVSLAFVENDARMILEKAIAMIPKDSEYYAVVSGAYQRCLNGKHWEEAWRECEKQYSRYNWIHAYPNAAAEVIALWFGNGDFDETMHIVAMEGQDVDCNAAQIGTVVGIIHGRSGIAKRWVEPIGNDLATYVRGYQKMKITELARWTSESVKKSQAAY